eukprot:15139257-Alexandrium_andersonii.AAC.1
MGIKPDRWCTEDLAGQRRDNGISGIIGIMGFGGIIGIMGSGSLEGWRLGGRRRDNGITG